MLNRICWSSTVRSLMEAGLHQKQIGEETGISQPVVSRLSSGVRQEPSHSEGEALRALFAQTFPNQPIPELVNPQNEHAAVAESARDAINSVAT